MDFSQKHCIPCEGGVPPLTPDKSKEYKNTLVDWELMGGNQKIKKKFTFKDFKQAMNFVNKVADIANEENHHPNISIFYNKVELELWTHAIGGLSDNDFIIASKVDKL